MDGFIYCQARQFGKQWDLRWMAQERSYLLIYRVVESWLRESVQRGHNAHILSLEAAMLASYLRYSSTPFRLSLNRQPPIHQCLHFPVHCIYDLHNHVQPHQPKVHLGEDDDEIW